jgi:hypothetical protein
MKGDEYIRGKTTEELLAALYTDSQPTSRVLEQQRMAIFARSAEAIAQSIRDYTASNDRLSSKLFWLNIIFGTFTVVGTGLAVWSLL